VPGTAYIEGGTGFIYFNGSSGTAGPAAEAAVSYATSPNRYIFGDSGGITPGSGCSAVDAFTVNCPRAAPTQVRVQIGDNDATDFNVFTTAGDFVQVIGGTGDDNLHVYSSVGNMRWVGGGGDDRLLVRDLEYTLGRTYTVSWNGGFETLVARTGVGGINYQSDVERIELLVGELAAQTVNIESAPDWAEIYVQLGLFGTNDVVQISPVAGALDAVDAQVKVIGGSTDVVLLNDANKFGLATFAIDGDSVDRLGFGGLTHSSALGQVNVYGGGAGSTFDVISSLVPLALFGGAGGDVANLGDDMSDLQGNVSFLPAGGNDILNVDDSGSAGPHAYTLNEIPVQYTRAGSDGVSWENATLEAVNLFGTDAAAGDTFNLNAWHPAISVEAGGGNDIVNVRANGRKASLDADVVGGPGTDEVLVDNNFFTSLILEAGTNYVIAGSGPILGFSQIEALELRGGSNDENMIVTGSAPGLVYELRGNLGADLFTVGSNLTALAGPVNIIGGGGIDEAEIIDTQGPSPSSYEIRGARFQRLGSAPIDLAVDVESAGLSTTLGVDMVRLLATLPQINVGAAEIGGSDEARVFAAGLATGGTSALNGGANTDLVRLYTGGTGASFGVNSIVTPGKQTVSLAEYELSEVASTSADSDGDGCPDAREVGANPQSGGDRLPDDFWDFYDVTDDAAIDVEDVIAILNHFGEGPLPANEVFDRHTPDASRRHRPAFAGNGIDVVDAIANLQSFGHSCV
jgi:hypothetical protein